MEDKKYMLDGSKVLWHSDRIREWNYGMGRVAPITIDCALTTKCSYRCVYCYGKIQCINQSCLLNTSPSPRHVAVYRKPKCAC